MKFLSDHLPLFCRPMQGHDDCMDDSLTQSQLQTISTLELRDYLKEIPASQSLDNFLESIPYKSNYMINYVPLCNKEHSVTRYSVLPFLPLLWTSETHYCGCSGYLGTLYGKNENNKFKPSTTTIRKHIQVQGLDHECELILSQYQATKLNELKIT